MSGTLIHSPEQIIQYLMRDLAVATLPSANGSWPVYCSTLPEDPDNALSVIGTAPVIQGRKQYNGEVQQHYGIQLTVRSITHAIGSAKIVAIAETFSTSVLRDSVTIDSSIYTVQSISIKSGPIPLGDEVPQSKRQIFTLNITAAIRQTT